MHTYLLCSPSSYFDDKNNIAAEFQKKKKIDKQIELNYVVNPINNIEKLSGKKKQIK